MNQVALASQESECASQRQTALGRICSGSAAIAAAALAAPGRGAISTSARSCRNSGYSPSAAATSTVPDLDGARVAAVEFEPHPLTSSMAAAGFRPRGARAGRGGHELDVAGDLNPARGLAGELLAEGTHWQARSACYLRGPLASRGADGGRAAAHADRPSATMPRRPLGGGSRSGPRRAVQHLYYRVTTVSQALVITSENWRSGRDLNPGGASRDVQPSRVSAVTTQACAPPVSRLVPPGPRCFRLAWQPRGSRNRWGSWSGGAENGFQIRSSATALSLRPWVISTPAFVVAAHRDDRRRGFQARRVHLDLVSRRADDRDRHIARDAFWCSGLR